MLKHQKLSWANVMGNRGAPDTLINIIFAIPIQFVKNKKKIIIPTDQNHIVNVNNLYLFQI